MQHKVTDIYRNQIFEKVVLTNWGGIVKEFHIKKQTLKSVEYKDMIVNKKDEDDTITYYQTTSFLYKNNINRWEKWDR